MLQITRSRHPLRWKRMTHNFRQARSTAQFWVDANDSATITQSNSIISKWADKSGNERNATLGGGTPEFAIGDGPNGLPFIKFRRASGEDFLNVGGTEMIARHMFYVCRSPTERWNYYGGILGHQSGRGSNYLFESNNFTYHSNRYPQAVYKNGSDLKQNTGFNMSPLTNFMILEIVVDNNSEFENKLQDWKK